MLIRKVSLLLLVLLAACSTAQTHRYHDAKDDSDTINALPIPGNSSFASNTNSFLAKEDAGRWSEQGFQNLVSITANTTSCLGTTGAGLTMTPTSCVAYNAGYRSTETGSITFPNASTCWVAMDENTSGGNVGLSNFTRVGTTHYLIDCIDLGQPAMAPDSQLLMKVVTSGGAITAVTDLRNSASIVNVLNYGAVGNGVTDNSAAIAAAKSAIGSSGTLFFPKGTYLYNTATALALTKANCNVTIAGDSQGGTYLKPNFSSADAISFIDPAAENPPDCHGGVRDISFVVPSSVPTNQNLMHVSNILGITLENVYAASFSGSGDSMFYLDAGSSPLTTFTERTHIINARSMFNTYMLTLDGKSTAFSSINNTELLASHCDPGGTGACVYLINMLSAGNLGGSFFEFNADLNAAGQSVLRDNHRADDMNGSAEFRIRAQSTTGSTNYCLDAPGSTGTWTVLGYIQCIGSGIVQERNLNPFIITLAPLGIQNNDLTESPGQLSITDPAAGGEDVNFRDAANSVNYWSLNAGFSAGVQGNFSLFDAATSTFVLSIAPTTDAITLLGGGLVSGSGVGGGAKGAGTANFKGGYYTNGGSAVEFNLSSGATTVGALGAGPIVATIADNAGHFQTLVCTLNANASCTTKPIVNVYDTASHVGTTLTCPASASAQGSATLVTQSLAFTAGDEIGIIVSTPGATCATPIYTVSAQIREP